MSSNITANPTPSNLTLPRCDAFAYHKACDIIDGGKRYETYHTAMTIANSVVLVDFFVLSYLLDLWRLVVFKKKWIWANLKAPQRIMCFVFITIVCNFIRFLLPVSSSFASSPGQELDPFSSSATLSFL